MAPWPAPRKRGCQAGRGVPSALRPLAGLHRRRQRSVAGEHGHGLPARHERVHAIPLDVVRESFVGGTAAGPAPGIGDTG